MKRSFTGRIRDRESIACVVDGGLQNLRHRQATEPVV